MITKIIPNQIYYQGSAYPPFYMKMSCTKVNNDYTIDTLLHKKYCSTSLVLNNWCKTKQEAIDNQVDYYLKSFHGVNMSGKADIYQEFVKDMSVYTKKHNPEFWL